MTFACECDTLQKLPTSHLLAKAWQRTPISWDNSGWERPTVWHATYWIVTVDKVVKESDHENGIFFLRLLACALWFFFALESLQLQCFLIHVFFLFQIYRSMTPWSVDNVTSTSTQLCRSKLNTRLHHWPVSNRSHGGGKNQSRIVEDLFYWRQTLIEQFSFQTTGSVKVIPFIVF